MFIHSKLSLIHCNYFRNYVSNTRLGLFVASTVKFIDQQYDKNWGSECNVIN